MNQTALGLLIDFMILASEPSLVFAAGVEFVIQSESLVKLDGDGSMHSWGTQTRDISGQWETTTNWLTIPAPPSPVPM